MSLILRGLTSIKVGATDSGDMGASLAALGKTYEKTAILTFPEDTVKELYNEEEDDPFLTLNTKNAKTLEWEIYDFDNANMVTLFGGTAAAGPPKTWTAPAANPEVERSIEILDKNSAKIEIPRAKLTASVSASLNKDDVARIKIKATILTPTNDAPITITEAAS